MKITVFTSNSRRHNYLINSLALISDELFLIQECKTLFTGQINSFYKVSQPLQKYFSLVNKSQNKIFKNQYVNLQKKKIRFFSIPFGDLKKINKEMIKDFLRSDMYVVFGTGILTGDLCEFLIKKKAINLHMGVSPFYRGTDCNFWAIYDNNPQLVGATIHLLERGVDNGKILYHAFPKMVSNPFDFSMLSVKAAIDSVIFNLKNNNFSKFKPIPQDKGNEIRYSKKDEFNDEIIKNFFNRKIRISFKRELFNENFVEPFFLK